jgi:hypothetical protein
VIKSVQLNCRNSLTFALNGDVHSKFRSDAPHVVSVLPRPILALTADWPLLLGIAEVHVTDCIRKIRALIIAEHQNAACGSQIGLVGCDSRSLARLCLTEKLRRLVE